MSSSVDNRVVQMEFDNASFERGVARTMKTLERLDSSLNFEGGVSGLSKLSSAVNGISFDGFGKTLASLRDTADSVFAGIAGAAETVLKTVTMIGSGVIAAGVAQAITGGGKRAANIEQARFQIQGLGMDYEALSEDISYAVNGTAFGFDEAAKAAAQFGASGVEAGDDMKKALRGISGIAAMTNSSYDEMARIFTRVAGNGRVMAIDLNSIAARGVNVAAALGKALGKTESEIREMVSRGEIDFATFSKAMDDAFGEHAMKANETFNGAFSNMKAALSRIGADFITPIREFGRESFLGVRAIIDNIRSGLNAIGTLPMHAGMNIIAPLEEEWSIVNSFVRNMDWAGNVVQESLTKIAESDRLKTLIGSFLGPADAIFYSTRINIEAMVTAFSKGVSGINLRGWKEAFDSLTPILTRFGEWTYAVIPVITTIFHQFIEIGVTLARTVSSIIGPPLMAFFDVFFGGVSEVGNVIISSLKGFSQALIPIRLLIENFELTEEQSKALGDVFTFLFNAVGSLGATAFNVLSGAVSFVGNAISTALPLLIAIGNVLVSAIAPVLSTIGGALAFVSEQVSSAVAELPLLISSFVDFDKIADILNGLASSIRDVFSNLDLSSVQGFFAGLTSGSLDTSGIGEGLVDLWTTLMGMLSQGLMGFKAKIEETGSLVGGFVESIKHMVSEIAGYVDSVLNPANEAIDNTSNTITKLSKKIKGEALSPMKNFMDTLSSMFTAKNGMVAISGVFTGLLAGFSVKFVKGISEIPKVLSSVISKVGDFVNVIPNISNAVVGVLNGLKGVLGAYQKEIQAEALRKIAVSIGILAASILLLSLINPERLGPAIAGVILLMTGIAGLIWEMSALFGGGKINEVTSMAGPLMSLGVAMAGIGSAMLLMAASAAILGHLDPDVLMQGVFAVGGMLAAIAVFAKVVKSVEGDLIQLGVCISAIAGAMILLSASIGILGVIPFPIIAQGLVTTIVLLAGLTSLLTTLVNEVGEGAAAKIIAAGVAMLAMAAAMTVFTASMIVLGLIPWENLTKGVLGLIGIFTAISIFAETSAANDSSLIKAALAVDLIAIGIMGLTASLAVLGSIDNVTSSLLGLAIGLSVIINALSSASENEGAMDAAKTFLVMGGALLGFSTSIAILGSMKPEAVALGLGAIAATFIVLGIAGKLLAPVVDVIFGLAASVALLGVGLMGIGAGLALFAAGLGLLAALGPAAAESIGTSLEILLSHAINMLAMLGAAVASAIVAFAEVMAENTPILIECGVELINSLITGLTESLPKIVEFAVQFVIEFLNGITENLSSVVTKGVEVITALLGGLASKIGDILDIAVMAAVMFIKGLGDTIRNNAEIVGMAVTSLVNSIGSVFLGGLADIVSNIPGFGEEMANGLRGISGDLDSAAEEASSQIDARFNEAYGDILSGGEDTMGDLSSVMSDYAPDLGSIAGLVGGDMSSSLTDELSAIPSDAAGYFDSAIGSVNAEAGKANNAGGNVGSSLTNGVTTSLSNLSSNMRNKVSSAVNSAGSVPSYGSGYGVGDNFSSGLYAGVGSWAGAIANRAAEIVRQAKAAANAEQRSASPSKDTMKIGGWFGEGYAIGIEKSVGLVTSKASDMVSAAKSTVSTFGSSFSDILGSVDWDSNLTIRPVLDLSSVESGAGRIGDLFSEYETLHVGSYIGRSYASMPGAMSASMGNTYNISLNWEAGMDANDMVLALGHAIAQRKNLEG